MGPLSLNAQIHELEGPFVLFGMKDTQDYLTPRQVAHLLRVDAMTVRKWIKQGILEAEAVKEGKRHRYRIAQQAVDAIQKSNAYRDRGT